MTYDLAANGLVKRDGIWYSKEKKVISYPTHGNEAVYLIEDSSYWFKHRNNCIIELLKKFPPDGAFYDVGGGNGFVSKAVQECGMDAVLIEPGATGCINARARKIDNVICSTLDEAGFEKKSMAGVGIFDVLEHIDDDIAFLKSINSYLQQDGLLCVTVPAYMLLWSKYDAYGGHYRRYTLGTLSKKLKEAGFGILYSSYIFIPLPLPIFLMRAIPSRLGMIKDEAVVENEADAHAKENHTFDKIWEWELSRIKANKTIPFGGTCIVMARKQ